MSGERRKWCRRRTAVGAVSAVGHIAVVVRDIACYSLTPDQQAPPTTPTTAPAPEPPAPKDPPVDNGGGVTAPTVSLPPAQPAGPPVEPAAGDAVARWWLPGLAGLSAGTLAGLGMWLLYRRRHPAAG
jgi:hypothetical protein